MKEINQRVMQVMEYYKLSKSGFANEIGVSAPVVTHISSGRNKVGLDVAQKILQSFPAISPTWLLLGEGAMLVEDGIGKVTELKTRINDLEIQISDLDHNLRVVKNTVKMLKELL